MHIQTTYLLEMCSAFPDFAHRRFALLPFALLNWSISAPVPVGVLGYERVLPSTPRAERLG